jgi:hypothetical protein
MINKQINSLNEEYIIDLTNKGMYKRALKSLEKNQIIKINENHYKTESYNIKFKNNIFDFTCDCEAVGYCKHVIMIYIYLMNNKESQKITLKDYEQINEIDNSKLKKYTNQDKINETIINYDQTKITHQIEENLKINIKEKTYIIDYPFDIEMLIKKYEIQEIIIIIKYIQTLNNLQKIKIEYKPKNINTLKNSIKLLHTLLEKGLYNLNTIDINEINYMSIELKMKNYNIYYKKLQYLKTKINDYLNSKINSNLININENIINILKELYILTSDADDYYKYKIINKTIKNQINEINAYILNYHIIKLINNNILINLLLLNTKDKKIYTLSNIRKNTKNIQNKPLFINDEYTAEYLKNKQIKLKNCIIKNQTQISNSNKMEIQIIENKINIDQYTETIEQSKKQYIKQNIQYHIIKNPQNKMFKFNEIKQRIELQIEETTIYYNYSEEQKNIMEKMLKTKNIDKILVKFQNNERKIEAEVII